MPQFDFSTALPQILWLVASFVALYLTVARLLPRVSRVVDERAERIAADLSAAEAARRAAEEASSSGAGTLDAARAEALARTGAAKTRARAEAEARLGALDAELGLREEQALATLDAGRRKALAGLEDAAAEIAVDLVARAGGVTVSAADAVAAVRAEAA
jgi:F-type H+-transporting ATPase subunit b